MSAGKVDGTVQLVGLSAIGEYHEESSFVTHVGALDPQRQEGPIEYGMPVEVIHVRPPYESGAQMDAHVFGECLNESERDEALDWCDRMETELHGSFWRQYVLHPPFSKPERRNDDPDKIRTWRFSCVGFVMALYAEGAGLCLAVDLGALPQVSAEKIGTIYGEDVLRLVRKNPGRFGLSDDESGWKFVLPGYLFHSLARSGGEIRSEPYVAQCGDEEFP